ncbi:hypothetical protein MBLNU459_g4552t1 [Dothideomycetes sp. NU459]
MATAQFAQMGAIPHALKPDLDMDSFFDFNQSTTLNSPQPLASSSRSGPTPRPSQDPYINNAPSPYDAGDDRQVFAGPSHEYDRFKQQTGLPVGSVASFTALNQPISDSFAPSHAFGGFNSGADDMTFGGNFDASWSTGLDVDADMGMDFNTPQPAPMFYSNSMQGRTVDPSSIGAQEEPQVGRLWPGMHQQQAQQAAMAKAQQQAQAQAHQQRMQFEAQQQHQRRMAQQQQQQQQQQQASQARSRASTYQNDPHTEESISRLLNQMRQNSAVPSNLDDDASGMPSHAARMRKEEEDMDEDERLLASEEGKKLSSKERRQLRNKVSARAFRSRRKEYIGQLEGDLAVKAQECNDLRTENRTLSAENARYRNLIETLLRHPAYTPFIEDISKDPSVIAPSLQIQPSAAPTPVAMVPSQSQDVTSNPNQLQVPRQREQRMAMVPEHSLDISMLNLDNANNSNQQYAIPSNAGGNFQQPQTYSVHDVPQGPSPLELSRNIFSVRSRRVQQDKSDFPVYQNMRSASAHSSEMSAVNTIIDEEKFPLYTDDGY